MAKRKYKEPDDWRPPLNDPYEEAPRRRSDNKLRLPADRYKLKNIFVDIKDPRYREALRSSHFRGHAEKQNCFRCGVEAGSHGDWLCECRWCDNKAEAGHGDEAICPLLWGTTEFWRRFRFERHSPEKLLIPSHLNVQPREPEIGALSRLTREDRDFFAFFPLDYKTSETPRVPLGWTLYVPNCFKQIPVHRVRNVDFESTPGDDNHHNNSNNPPPVPLQAQTVPGPHPSTGYGHNNPTNYPPMPYQAQTATGPHPGAGYNYNVSTGYPPVLPQGNLYGEQHYVTGYMPPNQYSGGSQPQQWPQGQHQQWPHGQVPGGCPRPSPNRYPGSFGPQQPYQGESYPVPGYPNGNYAALSGHQGHNQPPPSQPYGGGHPGYPPPPSRKHNDNFGYQQPYAPAPQHGYQHRPNFNFRGPPNGQDMYHFGINQPASPPNLIPSIERVPRGESPRVARNEISKRIKREESA